jgi:NAD(P)-dependent dehydrogenase (short-subunit alcohol dehydrogenase family)
MWERTAVVTGAYGGLGSVLCRQIAMRGIRLVFIDRNRTKSKVLAYELQATFPDAIAALYQADLSDHEDIRRVCAEVVHDFPKIDFLFNNAGVLTETLEFSANGNELHFDVNALAPLQLIDGLRPALSAAKGAMVVSTSAGIALGAKTLVWNELLKPTRFRKLYGPYVNSKAALNVLSAALAPELKADDITIRAVDPGPNQTRLTKGNGTPLWMRLFYPLLPTPDKGAAKIFDAAISNEWGDASGVFISGGKIKSLPDALADQDYQIQFLRQCREQVR